MPTRRKYMAVNEASRIHGERIRETRIGLGMTQRELAELFGVWRETITRIENGFFDIVTKYPRYPILNERMRIWAEMNKGGNKQSSDFRKNTAPENLMPHSTGRKRYWEPFNRMLREQRQLKKKLKGENRG